MGLENTSAIIRLTYAFGGQVVATQIINGSSTLYYIHNDHLGSNSRMSTSAGSAVAGSTARYTPFGDWRTEPTASLTDRGYTGHLHNNLGSGSDDLDLIYMNARYYLPSSGRFISPDTIVPDPANPQSYNRYSYVYNNPILYIDPSGHCGTITVEYNENGDTTTGRDLSDSQCWQQYDDLYNQLLANNVLHIEEIIGTGADYQYHEGFDTYQRSIVTLMDHYLRCGGVCVWWPKLSRQFLARG